MNSHRMRDEVRRSEHVCDACRQPVDSVVERHKTLGIYVPRWTAGPCHNPHCERCVPERVKQAGPPA